MISAAIWKFYRMLQTNPKLFGVLVGLQWIGVNKIVRRVVTYFDIATARKNPTQSMKNAEKFFYKNKDRVEKNKNILQDEKSKKVYQAVIDFRTDRKPIPKELYSFDDQYFPKDIIPFTCGGVEVFIDGGGYTGDTIRLFMKRCKCWKSIISFEPDEKCFAMLKKKYGSNNAIHLYRGGLYGDCGELYFCEKSNCSKIVDNKEEATSIVPVFNIDNIKECKEATFIKMDIEGCERDALYGAKETIMKNHPKLAICIYHSDEDMIGIIEYVHALIPEYKLYVRHHTWWDAETVLYACI